MSSCALGQSDAVQVKLGYPELASLKPPKANKAPPLRCAEETSAGSTHAIAMASMPSKIAPAPISVNSDQNAQCDDTSPVNLQELSQALICLQPYCKREESLECNSSGVKADFSMEANLSDNKVSMDECCRSTAAADPLSKLTDFDT